MFEYILHTIKLAPFGFNFSNKSHTSYELLSCISLLHYIATSRYKYQQIPDLVTATTTAGCSKSRIRMLLHDPPLAFPSTDPMQCYTVGWLADATRHYYCCTFHINNKIHGKRRTPHPPLEVLPCRILKWYSWAPLNSSAATAHRAFFSVAAHKDPKKMKTRTEPNSCQLA